MNEAKRVTLDPLSGTQIRVGVMGSAGGEFSDSNLIISRRLGRAIASSGCCLLTGACVGLPHEAVLGAKEAGGMVLGISPALNLREHVDVFKSTYREYDFMIYTGLGLMGRELVNIRSSDIVIFVAGRSGTLGEFAIAFEEGRLLGVVTDTGGVSDAIPGLLSHFRKNTGAEVLYNPDPDELMASLLKKYLEVRR